VQHQKILSTNKQYCVDFRGSTWPTRFARVTLFEHGPVENGATEKQMMDIFGWTKSDLAAYYARGANQPKIAGGAMHTLVKKAS
jgi:hypothetical protein